MAKASVVTEPVPAGVLVVMPTELGLEPPKRAGPGDRFGQPSRENGLIDRGDEALHHLVRKPRSGSDHEQPPVRRRVEVIGTLADLEQLRRPQRSVGHVDVGLAPRGLIKGFAELVERDWQ